MSDLSATIDHVVITVGDRLDAALAQYTRLGFDMTERGHHTLGSSNHLAIFGQDYLELLGYEPGRAPQRVGLAHPSICPYGAFPTRDGAMVLLSIQNEREWAKFCAAFLRQHH